MIKADLHLHSCLSPCASLDMSPIRIAQQAKRVGLDLIALTDHNSARNCPAMEEACQREGLSFLPGIEVTTCEEVHMLCLFDSVAAVMDFDEWIFEHLPYMPNDPERFGEQPVVDIEENVQEVVDACLHSATTIFISELVQMVHARKGLVIPSHIERTFCGILGQLGFLPDEAFDALEVMDKKNGF